MLTGENLKPIRRRRKRTWFELTEIPEAARDVLGEPDPGTHIFRALGLYPESYRRWLKVVEKVCPHGFLDPRGVAALVKVSPATPYKRLKENRLTAFVYHQLDTSPLQPEDYRLKSLGPNPSFGDLKVVRTLTLIPLREAWEWQFLLQTQRSRTRNSVDWSLSDPSTLFLKRPPSEIFGKWRLPRST